MLGKTFVFNNNDIRIIVDENNTPYFVAKDVCNVLGYQKSTSQVISTHCKEDGCTKMVLPSSGGNQETILINEGNLYRLILKSKKQEAEKFESWVCDEVLPSIRRNGAYATEMTIENIIKNPEFGIQLLEKLKQETAEKEKLQLKVKHDEMKIAFIDRVIVSEDLIDIGQCAKILELPFGRNSMFKILREKGIFFKNRNEPKQVFIEKKYFKLKEQFIETKNHGTKSVLKVLVTQRGLGFLTTLFSVNEQNLIKKTTQIK